MGSISAARYGFSIKIPGLDRVPAPKKTSGDPFSADPVSGIALCQYGNIVTTFLPRTSSYR
jgi:hypothetical protein